MCNDPDWTIERQSAGENGDCGYCPRTFKPLPTTSSLIRVDMVTSGVAHFWRASTRLRNASGGAFRHLQQTLSRAEQLGSEGLYGLSIVTSQSFAACVEQNRAYYAEGGLPAHLRCRFYRPLVGEALSLSKADLAHSRADGCIGDYARIERARFSRAFEVVSGDLTVLRRL